jgi:HSP20 family protein
MMNEGMNMQKEMTPKKAAPTGDGLERTRDVTVFIPRTDIYERKDAIVVTADLPGVDEKAVDINVEKNVLTITGRVNRQGIEGHRLIYSEYQVGDYQRTFTLSNDIDVSKIEASMKDGVLRITLPKSEKVLPRKIAVTAG